MLDIIRVFASAVVAYGHLTQHFFSSGWTDQTVLARDAVAVFFVLSGFVIRHVTCRRRTFFKHYLGDRASRIYSIAGPALLLTLITDMIAKHINPGFYGFWASQYTHPFLRIFRNLIFCGNLWTHIADPLSNSAYWSVNYEVAYYILYGCAFYLAGKSRWFWIAAICLFFGPRVVYLAPLWIAGCLIHDIYQRWNAAHSILTRFNWVLPAGLLLLVMRSIGLRANPLLFDPLFYPHLNTMANSVPVRPADYAFGLVWTMVFMGLLLLARRIAINPATTFVRTVRFISEGTFPIYLTHFPLYVLIAACVPYNHANPLPKIIIYICVYSRNTRRTPRQYSEK